MAKVNRSTKIRSEREAIEAILEAGVVVEALESISLIGLRIVDIEAKVFIVSLATYTRYAETIRETLIYLPAI